MRARTSVANRNGEPSSSVMSTVSVFAPVFPGSSFAAIAAPEMVSECLMSWATPMPCRSAYCLAGSRLARPAVARRTTKATPSSSATNRRNDVVAALSSVEDFATERLLRIANAINTIRSMILAPSTRPYGVLSASGIVTCMRDETMPDATKTMTAKIAHGAKRAANSRCPEDERKSGTRAVMTDAMRRYAIPPIQIVAATTWTISVPIANHLMSLGVAAL